MRDWFRRVILRRKDLQYDDYFDRLREVFCTEADIFGPPDILKDA